MPTPIKPTSDLHREIGERLSRIDFRYTTGRRRIVDVLAAADGPLALPAVLATDTRLSQSSAYRNLSVMEDAGVVRRIATTGDHTHYELAEEFTHHHHHLICAQCGLVRDFVLSATVEQALDRALADAASAAGFIPADHAVDLYGSCATCAS